MGYRDLEGATVLVTGAGTRVGAQIALSLGQRGCDVAVHYATNERGASEVVSRLETLGRRATAFQADLTDRTQIDRVCVDVGRLFDGRLDILVNNAANFERVEPADLDAAVWDRAMALNATAPYLMTIGLRDMLEASKGCAISIACTSAERPWRNFVSYSVSKAALVHSVRALALALAPSIRVNAVAPGAALIPDDYSAQVQANLLRRIPLGRYGDPRDIARAVEFLASNDYVTGHVLTVDGGLSLS